MNFDEKALQKFNWFNQLWINNARGDTNFWIQIEVHISFLFVVNK